MKRFRGILSFLVHFNAGGRPDARIAGLSPSWLKSRPAVVNISTTQVVRAAGRHAFPV